MGWVDPTQELDDIHAWFEDRDLELELFEREGGRWRAIVSAVGESKGVGEFIDGLDKLDAARRAQRRYSTRQLRMAMDGLAKVAQSDVVQLLAAELLIARVPLGRGRAGRRMVVASAVWMLDPERRKATRAVGRVAGDWARVRLREGSAPAKTTPLPPVSQEAVLSAAEKGLGLLRTRLAKTTDDSRRQR
jgi:hypothetical protein